MDHRIGLYLGHNSLDIFKSWNFKSFLLYIHEKGQFWPKSQLDTVYSLPITSNQYKVLNFNIEKEERVFLYKTHVLA